MSTTKRHLFLFSVLPIIILGIGWLWSGYYCRRQFCIMIFRENLWHPVKLNYQNLQIFLKSNPRTEKSFYVFSNQLHNGKDIQPQIVTQRPILVFISQTSQHRPVGQPILVDQHDGKNNIVGWLIAKNYPTHLSLRVLLLDPEGSVTTILTQTYNNSQVALYTTLDRTVFRNRRFLPEILPYTFNIMRL